MNKSKSSQNISKLNDEIKHWKLTCILEDEASCSIEHGGLQ
tara:strand:- start:11894 stop:12016 length:123 start_codon:yes stop_codon:yes gene_type:complete